MCCLNCPGKKINFILLGKREQIYVGLHDNCYYITKVETNKIPGKHAVTTGELADFMVKVFMDRPSTDQFRHCMLGISSEPKICLKEFKIPALSVLIVAGAFVVLYYRLLPVVLQEFLDEVFK